MRRFVLALNWAQGRDKTSPMKTRLFPLMVEALLVGCVCLFGASSVFAKDFNLYGQLSRVVASAPRLDYPAEAVRKRIMGGGVYRMNVSPAGSVTATEVVQSTGSPILDRAALTGLKRWRFKPGSVVGWARTPCLWSRRGYYFSPPGTALENSPVIAIRP